MPGMSEMSGKQQNPFSAAIALGEYDFPPSCNAVCEGAPEERDSWLLASAWKPMAKPRPICVAISFSIFGWFVLGAGVRLDVLRRGVVASGGGPESEKLAFRGRGLIVMSNFEVVHSRKAASTCVRACTETDATLSVPSGLRSCDAAKHHSLIVVQQADST